jgi:hypothetical protein
MKRGTEYKETHFEYTVKKRDREESKLKLMTKRGRRYFGKGITCDREWGRTN